MSSAWEDFESDDEEEQIPDLMDNENELPENFFSMDIAELVPMTPVIPDPFPSKKAPPLEIHAFSSPMGTEAAVAALRSISTPK